MLARASYLRDVPVLKDAGANSVYSGEGEVALAFIEDILDSLGATPEQIDRERARAHGELSGECEPCAPDSQVTRKECCMRWQIGWQGLVFAIAVFMGGLFLGSHLQTSDPIHSSAAERLQPAATVSTALTPGATVYVPVYSSLYLGLDVKQRTVELAATVSVRNVSRHIRSSSSGCVTTIRRGS